MNACVTIIIALYFLVVSKYWVPFQIFFCVTNALCCISIAFVPESPKYLISKKLYDEARQSLLFIAKFNKHKGVSPLDFKFDREVIDSNQGSKINHSISQSIE